MKLNTDNIQVHHLLLIFVLSIQLIACGGSGGGTEVIPQTPETISGTAATGVALVGSVNVYGSNGGNILDVPVDASGNYTVDVSGLTGPFFICAVPENPILASQYSWANGPSIANITPLTTLSLFYANGQQDPASLIGTWPANQASVSINLPDAQAVVNANFVGVFSALNAALNVDFATYDFFLTGFTIGDILDQILDLLDVDFSNGSPVITVNNSAFNFDSGIDISGIDIGGSGAGSTVLGTLTVAGVDASAIGTSYKPTQVQVIPVLNSSTVVTWLNNDGQVAISGINGNQLTLISFTIVRVANAGELQFDEYSYALDCSLSGIDCSNIQVDTINKQAVFNNLELPLSTMPITENMATGPVTLVGTLTWD